MDSDFASKLQSVLSNPEAMAKITSIASSLGTNPPSEPQTESQPQPEVQPQISNPSGAFLTQGDPRLALLASVKPLLREDKRGRVDSLLTALTMANVLKNFKK